MDLGFGLVLIVGIVIVALLAFSVLMAMLFRRVVSTNEVHIVQSAKRTTSYGKDTGNGNTYYQWPAWVPVFGVTKIVLPVSVFDLDLLAYEAYDKGRLPFMVDVKAFFRITDSNVAAQRVASFEELHSQLKAIVQGAVRTILASNEIEQIMQGRSEFGAQFTSEVESQLSNWGVATVKNIELMDIRDGKESHVIRDIMEKKKSHIEMESRTEVAKNRRIAEIAEIEANRDVQTQQQEAAKTIGLRTVDTNRTVEVAKQEALQVTKEQEKLTKEREMAILNVAEVKTAEIQKEVNIVRAKQDQETAVISAEAQRKTLTVIADGQLEAKKKEAEGIEVTGRATASAEKAMQLAPVEAQIVLAKEIGSNESYQKYLVTIEQVRATQAVGIEQARALTEADVKIISNTGTPTEGMNRVMDLFSSAGGTQIGAMLEALAQTDTGKAVLEKAGLNPKDTPKVLN